MPIHIDDLAFLQLTQLADSALPIGSAAHSYGLETLVAEGWLTVEQLEAFLRDYLHESGELESSFCRLAHRLAAESDQQLFTTQWLALNNRLSAFKVARESRTASATLGRRFLQLAHDLTGQQTLSLAQQTAKASSTDIHYSPAFGLVSGILAVEETASVLAYLHQSLLSLVSACQRLMPLGQSQASAIIWRLKPVLLDIACRSEMTAHHPEDITVFTPLMDAGSMRHPHLPTRLFIS